MADAEKVINGLRSCIMGLCDACPYYGEKPCEDTMKREALALLKAQTARVMTLDEVRAAEVVWLEQVGACVCAIKIQNFDSGTMSFAYAYNNYTSFVNIKPEYYGKVSRCWTSRPDEKVRAETAWVEPPKEDNDDEQ